MGPNSGILYSQGVSSMIMDCKWSGKDYDYQVGCNKLISGKGRSANL